VFLPLGTDRPLRRPTRINNILIGINVAMFLVDVFLQRYSPDTFLEVRKSLWLHGVHLTPWSFFTYQFLHAGFMHLFGNMLFLFVFGPNLEDRLGRWWYLAFYLIGGAIAGGVHVMWSPESPVVGASGAISAVTGGFLVFFPRTKIRIFMFFIIIGMIQIPAVWFIGAQIALNLFDQGFSSGSNVAYMAHLGGYVYGIAVGFTLLATGAVPREAYDLFSLGKQAHRRRVFRELTTKGDNPWESGNASGKVAARRAEKVDPRREELSRRRSQVSELLSQHKIDEAARAYSQLRKDFESAMLNRDAQLTLANHYFQNGDREDAAESYALFLSRHGTDREAPGIRLMLALLYARYLDKPAEARELLKTALERLTDPAQVQLANALLTEVEAMEAAS